MSPENGPAYEPDNSLDAPKNALPTAAEAVDSAHKDTHGELKALLAEATQGVENVDTAAKEKAEKSLLEALEHGEKLPETVKTAGTEGFNAPAQITNIADFTKGLEDEISARNLGFERFAA